MKADQRLLERLDAHFFQGLPKRMGVAVSGGSDSLALLHLCKAWGKAPVFAVTVDHGLRPEGADEAAYVAETCKALEIPHTTLKWEGWDGKGNLQAEARRTRYSLIAEWATQHEIDTVMLGHTMDDQAETFLMRLARKAGVDGLAAMASHMYRHGAVFDRPLLACRRDELRAYLERKRVRWVEDPTNEDDRFDRVKARRVLEALEPLGIDTEILFDVSSNLADASLALGATASEFAQDNVRSKAGDLIFDRTALRRLPVELMRRLLSAALRWVASAEYAPRRDAILALEGAVEMGKNTTLHGCQVLVSGMTVRITREHAAVATLATPSDQPWDARWWLDGPHAPDLEVRALGEAVKDCPDWRALGLPRVTLLASPAVWRGDTLVAAPVAGLTNGWAARTRDAAHFAASLI